MALHGLGANEDAFMDRYGKLLPQFAEKYGFIAVAPLGYRIDGSYGRPARTDELSVRKQNLSEMDTMEVLRRMTKDYQIDSQRIYLLGHSMGGYGTWYLASRYPDTWAALGSFAGGGKPESVKLFKHIPQFIVHGDADKTVPVEQSQGIVAELKKLGTDHVYIEVPGGGHSDVVEPNFEAMIKFLMSKTKQ
jgi:predicted peptidase